MSNTQSLPPGEHNRLVFAWDPITRLPAHNSECLTSEQFMPKIILAKRWHCSPVNLFSSGSAIARPLPPTATKSVLPLKSWELTSLDNFRNLTQKYILSNLVHLHGREHVLQDLISFLWGLIINFEIFRLIINILLIKLCLKQENQVPKYLLQP